MGKNTYNADLIAIQKEQLLTGILEEKWANIFINRFVWSGLPEELNSYFIEKVLYRHGIAALYKDKLTNKYLFFPLYNVGVLSAYNEVQNFGCISLNGLVTENDLHQGENAATCKASVNAFVNLNVVKNYVDDLVDLELAAKVNINANKSPLILETGEESQLTALNTYEKVTTNKTVIVKNKSNMSNKVDFKVHKTEVNYIADKLIEQYHAKEAMLFTYLGINHNEYHKKERQTTTEIDSNNEYIFQNVASMLEQRRLFCAMANKIFGLNISVELRTMKEFVDETRTLESGGDESGNLHNDTSRSA